MSKIVLGIDPGAIWTAFAVRDGDTCLDSATAGRMVLPDPDDDAAYVAHVIDLLNTLVSRYKVTEIHLESLTWPSSYLHGQRQKDRDRLRVGFNVARTAITYGAILGAVSPVVLIAPAEHEKGQFPKNLKGTRPKNFSRNENPRGDRRHEKAAFNIAGASK